MCVCVCECVCVCVCACVCACVWFTSHMVLVWVVSDLVFLEARLGVCVSVCVRVCVKLMCVCVSSGHCDREERSKKLLLSLCYC